MNIVNRHGMIRVNEIIKPIVSNKFSFLNIGFSFSCYTLILSV